MADVVQLNARLAAALKARAELEAQLTLPEVLADHTALARIGRELSRTAPLAEAGEALTAARLRVTDSRSLEADPGADAEMRELAAPICATPSDRGGRVRSTPSARPVLAGFAKG